MRDEEDTIMYVGKAKNLHNRVRSYFVEKISGRGPQIAQMAALVSRFEYIVVDSEMEALILENNLIKENRPRYNTLLKDDKTYPFIKVTVGEKYPRVLFSRVQKRDSSKYFGPYPSAQAVRDTIDLINRLCELRTCSRNLPKDIDKERACIYFHMEMCCAPCESGRVTEEEYSDRVEKAIKILSGNDREIIAELQGKMEKASEEMLFEEAAKYRDLAAALNAVHERQKITSSDMDDRDIIAMAVSEDNDVVIQVFFVRDGKIIGREHFFMLWRQEEKDILSEFIKQFYSGTPFVPKEIMLPRKIEEQELIEKWLGDIRGKRVYLKVPERGSKEKLMELARQNAELVLSQDKERLKREEGRTIGAVKEIEGLIGLCGIERMEAFDISNISGFANVGSMVVYEKGKPKRSDYRKFRIKSVAGPNDYACMHEVLTRRFRHGTDEKKELELREESAQYGSFTKFPDLILMDGGKGQVNIALRVLDELGIDIPVCGMVKDDRHRTRGLYYNNTEVSIDTHSEGFKLITRIQDEAHRFAITYHKSLRGKAQVKSILDDIEGIGPARRKALMQHFKSIQEIRDADTEALMQVPGIRKKEAENIFKYFNS